MASAAATISSGWLLLPRDPDVRAEKSEKTSAVPKNERRHDADEDEAKNAPGDLDFVTFELHAETSFPCATPPGC